MYRKWMMEQLHSDIADCVLRVSFIVYWYRARNLEVDEGFTAEEILTIAKLFLKLHFDPIRDNRIQHILQERACHTTPSKLQALGQAVFASLANKEPHENFLWDWELQW